MTPGRSEALAAVLCVQICYEPLSNRAVDCNACPFTKADIEGRKVRDAEAKERFKDMEASIVKTEEGSLYVNEYATFPPA